MKIRTNKLVLDTNWVRPEYNIENSYSSISVRFHNTITIRGSEGEDEIDISPGNSPMVINFDYKTVKFPMEMKGNGEVEIIFLEE